jgi:hypothetical protein
MRYNKKEKNKDTTKMRGDRILNQRPYSRTDRAYLHHML